MYGVKFTLRRLAFAVPLLLLVSVNVFCESGGAVVHHLRAKRALPLAVSNKRIQLLEDGLEWMTFRKNGRLMSRQEVAALFLGALKQHYIDSRFYRTFVIAFEHGVLPRLTLNENEDCDLDYTMQYKDPFFSSVTWHFQKKFTFKNYKERESSTQKFCDYRQGLICKPATKKCGCPEGSKMQPVSLGSPVKRCLVEENEICSLIDIDHGVDPNHKVLAIDLPKLIFNLEKPVSCKHGTQCRFKSTDITLPRCYNVNSGPWAPPYVDKFGNMMDTWKLGFGDECVLGLIATPGRCPWVQWHSPEAIGNLDGFSCFNFGPPRSKRSSGGAVAESRTGFCAHNYGPYGITDGFFSIDNLKTYTTLFSPFITPRTVPLRGHEMQAFFKEYLKVPKYFTTGSQVSIQELSLGASCSVKKSKIYEQTWSYFASLEKDPPPGQDYVPQATKTELWANLQRVIDITNNTEQKVCRIYGPYDSGNHIHEINGVLQDQDRKPTYYCYSRGWTDEAGNDGSCQTPGHLDTKAFDERFEKFRHHTKNIDDEEQAEEWKWDRSILAEYPDGVCLPSLEPLGKGRKLGDVYEGGFCGDGYVCYKDYSDTGNKYDKSCKLLSSKELNYACHQSGDDVKYSKCEEQWQDKVMSKELEKLIDSNLIRGEQCAYDIEKSVRDKIGSTINHGLWSTHTNKYKILHWLEKTRLSGGLDGGLCDRTKLLECKNQTGTCECIEDTQPRKVTVDGVEYLSDYCYKTMGSCTEVDPTYPYRTPLPLTESEKRKVWKHYGNPALHGNPVGYTCNDSNLCVYLIRYANWNGNFYDCAVENTGKTGYDLKPDPTTPKPTGASSLSTPESNSQESEVGGSGRTTRPPGWRVGAGCSLRANERLAGSLLIVMFICTVKIMAFSY